MSDLAGEAQQLALLITLQELDHHIIERLEEKQRLPDDVEAARKEFESAQQRADQLKTEIETVLKQRRLRERELEAQEARLNKLRDRMTELKTNKEYQSHLREVEQAKAEQGRLEEETLLLMEQGDLLRRTLATQEESAVEATRRFETEQARVESESLRLDGALARLRDERLEVVSHVAAGLLSEYQGLLERQKGLAVAAIERGACMGCRLSLPPQLIAEVRKGEQIQRCLNCRRMLYWPAHHVVERHATS